jgi:anti-sigma factor RsiW
MDCRTARLLLELSRPRAAELEASEAKALDGHLADCPDCAALAEAEGRADAALGRAMRDVPLPPGLRDRLLGRLEAQRRTWRRRRVFRGLAAAAAVLLVIGLGWYWQTPRRLEVDLAQVHTRVVGAPAAAEDVVAWVRSRGVPASVPTEFNYSLLVS